MNNNSNEIITVEDLLEIFIELKNLDHEEEQWTIQKFSDDASKLYRYLILKSLLRAFDIGDSISDDFMSGKFLDNRYLGDYEYVINCYSKYLYNGLNEPPTGVVLNELKDFFNSLLNYRLTLDLMIKYNDLIFESVNVKLLVTQFFYDYYCECGQVKAKIDNLLCSMIDPQKKSFTLKKLIVDFDYPGVDLEKIDAYEM